MFNAYFLYKIANTLYRFRIPLLPSILKFFIFLIYNSSIPYQCKLGKGTRFGYGGISVVLHKKCIVGKDCMISQSVTIGGRSNLKDLPVIGDNVYIGAGAKVLGDITIGNNVVIGANAVVIESVPDYAVVAGIPAKVIKYNNEL